MPDKSLHRTTYADVLSPFAAARGGAAEGGTEEGRARRHAHVESLRALRGATSASSPPAGVLHTLNLRLAPDDIGFIANHAEDRFIIVDDVLLPLFEQFKAQTKIEKVIVVSLTGKPVPAGYVRLRGVPEDRERRLGLSRDARGRARAPCATPRAPRAGRRAWSIRTARRCCTRSCRCIPDSIGISGRDVLLPVVPMFHANAWGVPYAAAMLGTKIVFPGPHLHPDDLLPLLESEKVTVSCGVPTIWLGMVQILEKNRGQVEVPARPATHRGRVRRAGIADPRLREAGHRDHPGLGHDRDLAARDHLQGHRRPQGEPVARTSASRPSPRRAIRCRWWTSAHPRRRGRAALGRQGRGRDPGAWSVDHRQLSQPAGVAGQLHRGRVAAHRRRGRGDAARASSRSPTAPRT